MRFNDLGVTDRGENFDVVIEFIKITAWAPYDQEGAGAPPLSGYTPLEVSEVGGLYLAAWSVEGNNPTKRSTYKTRLLQKLDCTQNSELVDYALRHNILGKK